MTTKSADDERHRALEMAIRYLIAGVIALFGAIGGLYLYSSERFASSEDLYEVRKSHNFAINNIRRDIKELRLELKADMNSGFDRIEKHIDKQHP